MRKLLIEFPERGVSAVLELLEDEAPDTTAELWDSAPFEGSILHDIWSGPQVFLPIETKRPIEPQNLTMFVHPGDVFYYSRDENYFRGQPYGKNSLAEIGIAYDRDAAPSSPKGQKSVNMCGRIVEGLDELAEVCNSVIFKGPTKVKITRYNDMGRN